MAGTEVLPDQGCGGVAQSPGRQDRKDDDANADGVGGKGGRAEKADNADQADPARLADQELQNSRDRHTHQAPENLTLEAHVTAKDTDAFRPFAEAVELVEDTDAAPGKGGKRRAGDSQFREWAEAEDQTGIKDQVKDVGDPEQAHGDGGIAGAAEDRVVEKEQQNNSRAAQGDAGVVHAGGDDLGRSAHVAADEAPGRRTEGRAPRTR